jgi:peptide/nickel transport system substrate-binding protein
MPCAVASYVVDNPGGIVPKPVAPRRKPRLSALLLVLVLIAAACGGSSKNNNASSNNNNTAPGADTTKPVVGGEVVYAQEAEDGGGLCLPEAQLDISGINYARTIYDTLTAPDADGKFVPFLAEKVEHNADATTWTITLRQGIKFHDGSDLTATVVKNNLDAYRGKYPGRTPILFSLVFGPYVKDVTADDATRTVTVTTNQPWPAFDSYLWSSARLGIMAQAQLDSGADCAKKLIGTGPFVLQDWVIGDHFTATKNPNYWQKDKDGTQLPYLDKITFKPVPDGQARLNGLQSGQFTMIHTSSAIDEEQLRALAKNGSITNLESDKFAEVAHLMLCTIKDPENKACPDSPFWNEHARKAVALALDRDTLNHVRGKDIPQIASGPFAPGAVGFLDDAGFPKFNLEEAKKEVQAYTAETGQPLKFTYGGTPDPEGVETQNFIKGMFEAAGMQVSTYTVEQTQYINVAVARNFQMYGWRNFPGSDPDSLFVWWHCNNPPSEGKCDNLVNFGGFNDATINADLDKGRTSTDEATRKAAYEDLNRQFSKELYNLWTSWTVWSVASLPKVHNVFGNDLPDGSKPFPGLATGHPMSGLFVTQ